MDTHHWHILGAGAIGILYASWLHENASFILNPASSLARQSLPENLGFSVEKNQHTRNFNIHCALPAQCKDVKNLLICTKAHQTREAIKTLSLSEAPNIVLMQNGMGNVEWLTEHYPGATIFCATTTHGAYRTDRKTIVHAGNGASYLGTLDTRVSHQKSLVEIANSLGNQETFHIDLEMEKRLWIKLAINCAINPLTAIHQCKNGELLDGGELEQHLEVLCHEIDKVLQQKGFLSRNASCTETVKQVATDTAQNFSSMNRDLHNKQKSEIDFIQGYLCTVAQQLSIDIPENQEVYDTIKKIEARY